MFPDDEIMVTLDYILGTPVTVIYTDEQRANNLKEIMDVVKTIKNIKHPIRRKNDWMCKSMCIGREECDKLWYKFKQADFKVEERTDKNE